MLIKALTEKRAIDASQFPFAEMQETSLTHSGIAVDSNSALNYIPVWACIRLLSETVASVPAHAFRNQGAQRILVPRQPAWLERPNPETWAFSFKERLISSKNLNGNSYTMVGGTDGLGYPSELWNLHPDDVVIERDASNRKRFRWKGTETLYPWDPGNPAVGQVLHIPAFSNGGDYGLNPIEAARQGIGLGLTTEQFGSRFFGSGQNPSGVIEMEPNVKADEDFKKAIKESWRFNQGGVHRSHLPAVLAGAKWKPISVPPETAQFLETRKFQKAEIASFFRVPPHMIGDVERSTSWGTGIEQQSIGFVVYSILPWLCRLESAMNSLLPRGQYLKWNLSGLLRGDVKSRYEAHAIAIQNGWMTRNEVRALEELNPLDGLDEPLVPNSNAVPADAPKENPPNDAENED